MDVPLIKRSTTLAFQASAVNRVLGYNHHKYLCDDGDVDKLMEKVVSTGCYELAPRAQSLEEHRVYQSASPQSVSRVAVYEGTDPEMDEGHQGLRLQSKANNIAEARQECDIQRIVALQGQLAELERKSQDREEELLCDLNRLREENELGRAEVQGLQQELVGMELVGLSPRGTAHLKKELSAAKEANDKMSRLLEEEQAKRRDAEARVEKLLQEVLILLEPAHLRC